MVILSPSALFVSYLFTPSYSSLFMLLIIYLFIHSFIYLFYSIIFLSFRAIEETATGAHDRPVEDVVISDCGVLQKEGETEDEAAKI